MMGHPERLSTATNTTRLPAAKSARIAGAPASGFCQAFGKQASAAAGESADLPSLKIWEPDSRHWNLSSVAHPHDEGHFFDDFSMQLPECSVSDTTFGSLPNRSKKLTEKLRNAVSTENPRITGD
jgi:hypothetical protein